MRRFFVTLAALLGFAIAYACASHAMAFDEPGMSKSTGAQTLGAGLDAEGFEWVTGDDHPWEYVVNNTFDGVDAVSTFLSILYIL